MIAFEMRHNMPSCENHSIANLVNLLAFIVCIPPFVIISIVVKLYNNNLKQEKFKNSNIIVHSCPNLKISNYKFYFLCDACEEGRNN